MTRVIAKKNIIDLNRELVMVLSNAIKKIMKEKENVILAIPGGRSVYGIFHLLQKEDLPWKNIHIFMIDERLVPITDKDSNFMLAKQSFIDELITVGILPKENVHPFIYNENIEDFGTKKYKKELKKFGGVFDIILLGSGEDGHVGALYPNHHSIENESEFFITMHDSPKPPKDRMSSSKNLLLRSKIGIILFIGEAKRAAYKLFRSNTTIENCPAKIIKSIKESYVVTDLE